MESMIAAQLARELVPIRRRLRAFHAIACIATLLGLLGAVTGLTAGFGSSCARYDAVSRATMLARGISESLNCTVFGLFVARCALAAGWLLHGRADELRAELDETAQQIEPPGRAPRRPPLERPPRSPRARRPFLLIETPPRCACGRRAMAP